MESLNSTTALQFSSLVVTISVVLVSSNTLSTTQVLTKLPTLEIQEATALPLVFPTFLLLATARSPSFPFPSTRVLDYPWSKSVTNATRDTSRLLSKKTTNEQVQLLSDKCY